jgi:hypothetical protein
VLRAVHLAVNIFVKHSARPPVAKRWFLRLRKIQWQDRPFNWDCCDKGGEWMLHHISFGVSNIERSAAFYDAAFATLG